jgi:soluble lytic murein transglycosylase-like protein
MSTSRLFPNENAYDALINQAASDNSVDPALIKGVIAQESNFVPTAYRSEPSIGDASYGLMQILLGTARGMGFDGSGQDLFDPSTNIQYGSAFLSDLIRQSNNAGYDLDSAISAYNGGFSSDRPGDGKRSTNRVDGYLADGSTLAPFINQDYVNKVLSYMQHYAAVASGAAAPVVHTAGMGIESSGALLLVGVAAAVFLFGSAALDRRR